MEDELLLNWAELIHLSFISVFSENNKISGFVNRFPCDDAECTI
jgi:hypothetical protein